jgi:ABC-type branched-subunit amino acid transport system permease subunit
MQFLFKTAYNDDIRFLAKTGEKVRVALVLVFLLAAPLMLQDYYLAELGLMLVYAIAGIGLMILTGHTGQVSFGHAGFLGIGAYAHSILRCPIHDFDHHHRSTRWHPRYGARPFGFEDARFLSRYRNARVRHPH